MDGLASAEGDLGEDSLTEQGGAALLDQARARAACAGIAFHQLQSGGWGTE